MVQNKSLKLTTKRETIYGWYPSSHNDTSNGDPKQIYTNLGSRPPRKETYHNAEVIYKYHQSVKQSELIYKAKQSVDEALKPPWALDYPIRQNEINEDDEKTVPESIRRVQSAPIPNTQQMVLKIPLPDMKNLFEQEDEIVKSDENVSFESTSEETNEFMNCFSQDEKIISTKRVVTAPNPNKKSLILPENTNYLPTKSKHTNRTTIRPKTVAANYIRDEPKEIINEALKRSKTSLSKLPEKNEITVKNTNQPRSEISLKPSSPKLTNRTEPRNSPEPTNTEEWLNKYLISRTKLKQDIKIIDGAWKEQLINRNKYLAKRPKYFVKINISKLKPDPPAPEIHYKAGETFFYKTMPTRKMTFTIDPNFISENLNITKVSLQNRPSSTISGPVRFRKDYAFVY